MELGTFYWLEFYTVADDKWMSVERARSKEAMKRVLIERKIKTKVNLKCRVVRETRTVEKI